eukprot:4648-Eustigmatos_ZCMA.PRE.1
MHPDRVTHPRVNRRFRPRSMNGDAPTTLPAHSSIVRGPQRQGGGHVSRRQQPVRRCDQGHAQLQVRR